MKKHNKALQIILILSLLLGSTMPLQAQHSRKKNAGRQFDFELRGGVNFCQIDGDASGNYNKLGLHGGVNTSFPLNSDGNLRFLVEIGLTQKGSKIQNSSLDRTIALTYVEVPLMVAYDMLDSRSLRIAAGVAPAILAKANVTTDGSYDALQSNNYKRLDAFPVCVSVRYRINGNIGVDVRWYNSLLNTAIENNSGTYRIFHSNKGQFNRLIEAGIVVDF